MAFRNEVIKISALQDQARRSLINILDTIRGTKVLALDKTLLGSLLIVADIPVFREREVTSVFALTEEKIEVTCSAVVFIVRPTMQMMKLVARNIKHIKRKEGAKKFYVYMAPRMAGICETVLKEENVRDDVIVGDFELDFIPLDEDLISMEDTSIYRQIAVDGVNTSLHTVAKAVMKLQQIFGLIPHIKAKGRSAHAVATTLLGLRNEVTNQEQLQAITPEIHELYILDREVDPISPLVTQLTYEGVIDELWGIRSSMFEPPFEVIIEGENRKKIPLNAVDNVFGDIRDKHLNSVGQALGTRAVEIKKMEEARHDMKGLKDMRTFMEKLPELQAEKAGIAQHIVISGELQKRANETAFRSRIEAEQSLLSDEDERSALELLEESISRQDPFPKILRLMSLISLTVGIKDKIYTSLRRDITQTYGFEAILTLDNLEKAGLLKGNRNYTNAKKNFRLFNPEVNEVTPQDVSYVHSGYAPLTARLVEHGLRPGSWKSKEVESLFGSLPGKMLDVTPHTPEVPTGSKVVMILFVGGCTFAEISAVRWLNENMTHASHSESAEGGGDVHFVVATTGIINGDTMMETLMEKIGSLADSGK